MPDLNLSAVALALAARLGGTELASQVDDDATAVADLLAPMGPDGSEPASRESVWSGAAWTLVDAAHSALVGQAVRTPGGGAWTVTPARCPVGHPDQPGRVLAGWRPCRCGAHHTWTCRAQLADGAECGAKTVAPEPAEDCCGVRAW